jgi:hypothetical protein
MAKRPARSPAPEEETPKQAPEQEGQDGAAASIVVEGDDGDEFLASMIPQIPGWISQYGATQIQVAQIVAEGQSKERAAERAHELALEKASADERAKEREYGREDMQAEVAIRRDDARWARYLVVGALLLVIAFVAVALSHERYDVAVGVIASLISLVGAHASGRAREKMLQQREARRAMSPRRKLTNRSLTKR